MISTPASLRSDHWMPSSGIGGGLQLESLAGFPGIRSHLTIRLASFRDRGFSGMRKCEGLTKAIVFERFLSRDNLKYGRKSWNGSTRKFNNFDCDGIFSITISFTPRLTRRMETYLWAPTEEQ